MRKSIILAALLLAPLAACSSNPPEHAEEEAHADNHDEEGEIHLTEQQIGSAGITLVQPQSGGAGVLSLPAMIEGDPQATQVVSAAIGGRVVSLQRNLGEAVQRGDVIAVIESREVAALRAEAEAGRARAQLARATLAREQRLFAERVTPEADLIAARTAATEADIAVRLAQQQLAAAGVGGGSLNRIGITAPIAGRITARTVTLGSTVAPDAELFRVSNLSRVAVTLSLSPADAGRIGRGVPVEVISGDRRGTGAVHFISPVVDETTRLVPVIVTLDNSGGLWRPGEPVSVAIQAAGSGNSASNFSIPESAIQSVEGRTTVFVRTAEGFRATPVAVSSRGGGRAVVTGLTGDERIAAEGSFTLKAELGKGEAEHGGH
ncbi:efflux RND transporter periplasmic adaptor subunit [Altererythrobacter xixiisoli]|uniref:Efflux RND transporter periplasmic adaptor subunit n=1 Tax=Croceibacterium xixiisoli TaxID=1476466 RepID=A0A6I4TQX0_9SPHN|nr:efflux RND transporter periplasmic adaptor subunit [Croceibacterium xixiisoli]MXO97501.1 efflux RND transporter periplasmic adaptor subunit [Croceibacterium xixiisoli]